MIAEYKVDPRGAKGFAAVIFDLDGVIVDSEPNHYQAYRQTLKHYGITLDHHYFARKMIGRSAAESLARLRTDFGVGFDVEAVAREVGNCYRSLARKSPRANLQIIDLIHRLKGKTISALGSGSSRENIDCILDVLDLNRAFDIVVSGDDVRRGKPDPAIFLLAAQRASVSPPSCAVLEDSASGIQAARSAGMFAIAVRSEYSNEADLQGADMVIADVKTVAVETLISFLVDGCKTHNHRDLREGRSST